ncbi:hypothetical protein [Subtercola sp. YIM 133946]|uniref:hypothetical protein n=1 Tax=Subtercola sp. YIM 133946 TaxID=3118909 RepID=UPI002F92FD4E
MTTTEPEWDGDQVAFLLASTERQHGKNKYGVPWDVATNKAYADRIHVDLVIDYVEQAVMRTQKEYTGEDYTPTDMAGWMWEAYVDEAYSVRE